MSEASRPMGLGAVALALRLQAIEENLAKIIMRLTGRLDELEVRMEAVEKRLVEKGL